MLYIKTLVLLFPVRVSVDHNTSEPSCSYFFIVNCATFHFSVYKPLYKAKKLFLIFIFLWLFTFLFLAFYSSVFYYTLSAVKNIKLTVLSLIIFSLLDIFFVIFLIFFYFIHSCLINVEEKTSSLFITRRPALALFTQAAWYLQALKISPSSRLQIQSRFALSQFNTWEGLFQSFKQLVASL